MQKSVLWIMVAGYNKSSKMKGFSSLWADTWTLVVSIGIFSPHFVCFRTMGMLGQIDQRVDTEGEGPWYM